MSRSALATIALACAAAGADTAPGQVISEIHYHPPPGDEALEFVEVSNGSAIPEDLSGYAFVEGIWFVFPPGTVLPGKGSLAVCADADAVKARHGIQNALGNYTGKLDGSGERLTLVNHAGITVQSLRYRDRGKWPVAADGTGHSLVLRNVHLDPSEPESWTQSPKLGGSPGSLDFESAAPQFVERAIVDRGATWRFRKGSAPFSAPAEAWLEPGFDDSSWPEGASGFGYGDGDDQTLLDDMQNGYTSVAIRKRVTLSAGDLAAEGEFLLGMDFDDGFCAFLNGKPLASENCSPAGLAPTAAEVATASREAGSEALFPLPKDLLVAGENVFAVAGYNLSVGSTDFSLIPRLIHRSAGGGVPSVSEEPLVDRGEAFRFVKGTAPFSSPEAAWRLPGFNDAGWAAGASGFGFLQAGTGTVAYEVPAGTTGNQAFGGSLGMDFNVNAEIAVTRLGVFDSGSDGLAAALSVRLYDRNSQAVLASLEFTPGDPGELVAGSRFKDLPAPRVLPAGFQGTIAAWGYGAAEPNGNQGTTPLGLLTHDGGGAISFVGGGRFGAAAGAFPDTVDGGPADRYAAGTFVFRPPGGDGGVPVAPAGVLTLLADMRGGYSSLALRKTFQVAPETIEAPGDVFLAVDYDDGFCAYLNGAEIARVACGGAGEEPAWDGTAASAREGAGELLFAVDKGLLREGENLLAIAGFNSALEDGDFRLSPRLFFRRLAGASPLAGALAFNELYRSAAPGGSWVELHNGGAAPADLSGHLLTESPDRVNRYALPPGTTVPPRGFLVLSEAETGLALSTPLVQLFLLDPQGLAVAASAFDREPPGGVAPGTYSECRFPDGGPLDWISTRPSPGAPNQVARPESIVINEIFYHPPQDRPGEFIEIHNAGALPADLSGFRLENGIDFVFGAGTTLAAGGYLVVAREPEVLLDQYGIQALGPYEGNLSNRGEAVRLVDRLGNPVDSVRYHEGGRWSEWADGGGSSLELIDPRQDNSLASAWEGSDETAKAPWEELSFAVADYKPAAQSELHLYLTKRGVCRIDDVSIRRGAGANQVPNPGFETSTSPWIIGGTHIRSQRLTTDRHSGGACLELVATGRGDTMVNRIEVETSPALTAGAYEVSLWARWQRGGSLLIAHGEYSAGPFRVTPCFTCGTPEPNLSGNPLAAALRLTVPWDLGTPGAENSATRRLRAQTGGTNLGPAIAEVGHSPPVPGPGEPVAVAARIDDADGVAAARVLYRQGSAAGPFAEAPLADDGLHGDGAAGDGIFGGLLPGFPASTRVVFYVEAADGLGAVRRFPVDAPAETCLFQALVPAAGRLERFQLILDGQRTTELQTRQLHSNDPLDATFVYEDEKVFYNVGLRYRGSPWGRPSLQSFRVAFPQDDRFHRGFADLNLAKTGVAASEAVGLFLIARNALPGRPSPATECRFADVHLNGIPQGTKSVLEVLDGDFLEKWYGPGSRGPLLEATGRFVFNDSGSLIGQAGWEGASLIWRGASPENYRGYYSHRADQDTEDWEPLIALLRALDRTQTPDAAFAEEVGAILDLDGFFRSLGARILVSDCDAFCINNGHNGYLAFNSRRGLWGLLPFDVECSWISSSPALFQSADPGVTRLLTHPATRRVYLRTLGQFLDGYWSPAAAGPFLDALQRATGHGTGGFRSHIAASGTAARSQIQASLNVAFRIVTNAGRDLTVSTPTVVLEGEASARIEALYATRGAEDPEPLEPAWASPTRWRFEFPLFAEKTEFEFLGFDSLGNLLGSTRIAVTTTSRPPIVVTGLSPDSGPAAGGTLVVFTGSGFAAGVRVRFGGVEASAVQVQSPDRLEATAPPAPSPWPAGGAVEVEVLLGATRVALPRAFTYLADEVFVRGELNGDGRTDLSDAIAILFHLFHAGPAPACEKSADIDDSGALEITDPIALLLHLFHQGLPPAAPFPLCGPDPRPDGLKCGTVPGCG